MSAEGLRDMKTMLAQLEADGPFDHTEAGPGGLFDTDYSGKKRAKLLDDLALARAEVQKLRSEKTYLLGLAKKHLTFLLSTNTQKITDLRNALNAFEQEMRNDSVTLQQMMHDDAAARIHQSVGQ
jgi:hypothetical protein